MTQERMTLLQRNTVLREVHNDAARLVPGQRLTYSEHSGFETGSQKLNNRLILWKKLFFDMVAIPSESGSDMREILQYVMGFYSQEHFQRVGVEFGVKEGAIVGFIPGTGLFQSTESKLLAGHVDTVKPADHVVPYIDLESMSVRSEGDQILGSDDLSAVAMIMAISEELVLSGEDRLPMEIIFTSDEESDGLQIEKIPVGRAKQGLILDRSAPVGEVVLGSYGYHRYDAEISGLTGERALEFLARFSNRSGYHTVGRRGHSLPEFILPEDITFSIDSISVGKNSSRNTVPGDGEITGTIALTNEQDVLRVVQIANQINSWLSPIGGGARIVPVESNQLGFQLTFQGQAGHPKHNEGVTSVVPDVAAGAEMLLRRRVPENPILTEQDVRLTLARVESSSSGDGMNLKLVGEARYKLEDEANSVLEDLQALVASYGGTMEFVRENRSYQFTKDTPVVKRLVDILERNDIPITFIETTPGIADANNGNREGRSIVVASEGTRNAHNSDEEIPIEQVIPMGNIIHDWWTMEGQAYAN